MERKEVAKAASQTEDAEKSLDVLKESYLSYKAQSTQQVIDLSGRNWPNDPQTP